MTTTKTVFSTLPLSVRSEGWELWESKCMEREDQDAREPPQETLCDTPDSAMSCLSAADSTTSRRPKLDTLVCSTVQRGMNSNQVAHLRGVKRTAQKRKHNVRSRKQATSGELHYLTGLIDDISSALSWQTQQVRESDGKLDEWIYIDFSRCPKAMHSLKRIAL